MSKFISYLKRKLESYQLQFVGFAFGACFMFLFAAGIYSMFFSVVVDLFYENVKGMARLTIHLILLYPLIFSCLVFLWTGEALAKLKSYRESQ